MTEPTAGSGRLPRGARGGGIHPLEIQPLAGDVSPPLLPRRLADGATAILATYPAEMRATCPRFLRTTEILAAAGVRVPRVLASDCEEGWMLVEDLGPQTLGEWGAGRPWSELGRPLRGRPGDRATVARLPPDGLAELNPLLGGELLRRELAQTWDLFLEPRGLVETPPWPRSSARRSTPSATPSAPSRRCPATATSWCAT